MQDDDQHTHANTQQDNMAELEILAFGGFPVTATDKRKTDGLILQLNNFHLVTPILTLIPHLVWSQLLPA
jgi:hypothetical protein